MVQFTLPRNSKINKGLVYKKKHNNHISINLKVYRWDPEENNNPRIGSI